MFESGVKHHEPNQSNLMHTTRNNLGQVLSNPKYEAIANIIGIVHVRSLTVI